MDLIPDALAEAYRRTRYLAGTEGVEAEARVGEASASIDALLAAEGADSGVFVTAWNPGSERRGDAENAAAHAALVRRLGPRRTLPHRGVAEDGGWTERGLFVPGLPEDEALALAREFGQAAVVAVRRGGPARLLATGVPAGGGAGREG